MKMLSKTLEDIAEVIAGQSPPSSSYNSVGDGIPLFQGMADFNGKHPKIRFWCNKPTKISTPNDILISVRAPVGPVIINNVKACAGRGLGIIRVNKDVSLDYVYYFLRVNERKISDLGVGSTFKAITLKNLKKIEVLIPEKLSDQIRIAEILSQAESLIAQRKQSIGLLDELLKSTFLEMFGQGENNSLPIQKLHEVTTKITDGEHGTVARLESGRLYFMARNITVYNTIDLSEVSYISDKDHEKIFKRCNPELGDLLMVCVGATIGKVALVPNDMEPFSLARSVALIKPNRRIINPAYLLWFFNSELGKKQIKNSTNESAQGGLYTGKLKEIKIPVPPITLQTKFGAIVEKVETLKTQYQQSLIELQNMYGVLSQRAFKGGLNYDSYDLCDSKDSKLSKNKKEKI